MTDAHNPLIVVTGLRVEKVVTDANNRRAQQRFDIELPVDVTYVGQTFATTCRNVSLGGMFLRLLEPIPFGALVRLRFVLPELDHPVEVDAHVRWVQPDAGIGVQYGGLRAREVWALQQLFSVQP